MLLPLCGHAVAAEGDTGVGVGQETDSAHFVTASLLVVTPGPDIYSVFGHTALRMECPSKGLDYCFTFETEGGLAGYLRFFAGQSRAGFVPVPTKEFIAGYRREGRGMTQYELNLTPREKQELWRALDNDMLEGAHRKFNLIQNNCTSMSMLKVESVLDRESVEFGQMPAPMHYNNGNGVRWLSRRSPWAQFVFMTFLGSEADVHWPLENKLNPELIVPVLRHAVIRQSPDAADAAPATGKSLATRPVLVGEAKTLLPMRSGYASTTSLTPNVVFGGLLVLAAIAMAVCLATRHTLNAIHYPLFILHLLLSLFLLYVTLVSGLFGVHWNWLLIPFSPLPFIIWCAARHRWWYPRMLFAYAAILVLFIAIVPWITTQLLLAHYLIVATLAVWCLTRGQVLRKHKTRALAPTVS